MTSVSQVRKTLKSLADKDIAEHSARYFKTGPGQYGEGDRFLGIRVPVLRKQVPKFRALGTAGVLGLLRSAFHEERLLALLILVDQFRRGSEPEKAAIYDLYLANTARINNWDLVDSSAHLIVGPWLESRSRKPLYLLARSSLLWERRIAMMATAHFIRLDQFDDTFAIADILLNDAHDLIHKVVGWMLREVGNRDHRAEVDFLLPRHVSMPRTMLRYAIEKFPEDGRLAFLRAKSQGPGQTAAPLAQVFPC
jgi:3-methyladenine DNA glycosylase AlkD